MKGEPLPTEFADEPPQEVAVLDKKAMAKAAKAAEEKEIARIRQQFNTRTMRIKTKLLADAGVEIERWGIKMVGHGRFACAGDVADRAIAAIEEDIQRLKNAPPAVIAELRMMQLRFNKQIIEVGKSHIDAAREAGGKATSNMQIAFPAGQPVVVAVSSPKPSVNDKEKALTDIGGGP